MSWRDKAKCKGAEPEMFAPLPGTLAEAEAVTMCWTCPVRQACLDEALAEADETTVRGGYTASGRRDLMRGRLAIEA